MSGTRKLRLITSLVGFTLAASIAAKADAVTDWNKRACDILGPASFETPVANRALALMHTAIYESVNAITKKYPAGDIKIEAPAGASVDAAVAAAARTTLLKLAPSKLAEIEFAYQGALAAVPEGQAKTDGIAVGERAAAAVLAARSEDGSATVETYRPYTIAGVYVPTVLPAVPVWPQRKPWLMSAADQFRPGPPPDLKSELWARDYNEIKAIGRKNGSTRTAVQTDIAKFWEATGPAIYHGLVSSVTTAPNREITQNARLLMAVTQAVDDAMIAVFDAKYHYNFWRPITAIRNGDRDGNDATPRDASWTPLLPTPNFPEYPCGHCTAVAVQAEVLKLAGGLPASTPVRIAAGGNPNIVVQSVKSWDEAVRQVSDSRMLGGVHYRFSNDAGEEIGRRVARLTVSSILRPLRAAARKR